MRTNTVITVLESGDRVWARLNKTGDMVISFGNALYVWIEEAKTPEVYAEMCERFGLKESKTEAA